MAKYNTFHYVISLLKAYGITDIVASPGTQNSTFNYLVQEDSDFNCYSIVDERSAVYVAIGIAQEKQTPVVITCTGATASRNYMSGLTEAYYRNIPIIALTFYNPRSNNFNMSPQYLDRSVSQNDIKAMSIHLPELKDNIVSNKQKLSFNDDYEEVPVEQETKELICIGNAEKGTETLLLRKRYLYAGSPLPSGGTPVRSF